MNVASVTYDRSPISSTGILGQFRTTFVKVNLGTFRITYGTVPMIDTDNVVLARQKLCSSSNAFSSASGSINPQSEHLIIGDACLVMNTCGSL